MACCISKNTRLALALGALLVFGSFVGGCSAGGAYQKVSEQPWSEVCSESSESSATIEIGGVCGSRMHAYSTEAACYAGHSTGCALGSMIWRDEETPFQDLEKAIELAQIGCDRGDEASCTSLATTLAYGDGLQFRRAISLLRGQCSREMAASCFVLAEYHSVYEEDERSKKLTVGLFKRSCELDHPGGCREYGAAFGEGRVVSQDPQRAEELYEEACRLNDRTACREIGKQPAEDAPHWYNADLLVSDDDVADMYAVACRNGFPHACTRLGRLLAAEVIIPTSTSRADDITRAFKDGCELGAIESCYFMAGRYEMGIGELSVDLDRAARLAKRACEGGIEDSCPHYRDLLGKTLTQQEAEQYASRCRGEDAQACYSAGRAYAFGQHFEQSTETAVELFELGCRSGDINACDEAALIHEAEQDFEAANPYWKRGCELGGAVSCHALGFNYRNGLGLAPDIPRGVELELLACERGHSDGCAQAAYHMMDGDGVEKDAARARELSLEGCNGETLWSCVNYGFLLRTGQGGPEDKDEAREIFEWSCDLGSPMACTHLGEMEFAGEAAPEADVDAAAAAFEKACRGDEEIACRYLAGMVEAGMRGGFSTKRAFSLYERSCGLGDAAACEKAVTMSTTNNELIRDRQHWVELRENACAAGFASPCQQASTAYRLAEGVDKDVERANQLLDRAIELGKSACMNGDSEQCRSTAHAIAHGRGVETDFPAAAQFLREACSADVPDACRLVASERIAGELFDRDPERGEKTLKELCSSGETRACFEFALIKRIGVVDLDLARSLEIFEEVCDEHGWLAACANAGFGYARGLGTQRDPERTAEFLSIACDENGGFACGPLVGAMMVFQPDELGDLNLLEVATESCERGKPYSCMAAGQLLQNGFQVEVDLDRARDFYATACEQKAVPACSRLRVLDMAQDADGDAAHLEKTCEDGTARSCLLLAMKHEFSSFDPDRLSRATRYYFQACQADNADGCTLVDRYEPINGAHLDTETASDLLERSCEHGSALQCLHAGLVLRQMNWPLSIEQYRSACDRGEEEACRHLLVNGYAVPETKSAKGD